MVCVDCVADDALKQLVLENVSDVRCDFCGREAEQDIAADADLVLERISVSLHVDYADPNDVLFWDSEDQEWAGAAVYAFDELLDEVTERPLGHAHFDTFVLDAFNETQWCKRDPAWVGQGDALRFGWDDLRETVKHRQRFFFVLPEEDDPDPDPGWPIPRGRQLLEKLADLIREHGLVSDLPARSTLYRARVHRVRDRYSTAKDLGAPPANAASQSRMSPAGIPMFYAAEDAQAALDETIDPLRTRVKAATIGAFETTESCRIVDLDLVPGMPSVFDDAPESRALLEPLGFLHGFRRDVSARIERDGRIHVEYVPTQVVCEYLRDVFRDADGQPVRGLAWESAQRPGARNIVLFIDRERCVEPGKRPRWTDGLLVELVSSERRRL
jgi:hypothetical protein